MKTGFHKMITFYGENTALVLSGQPLWLVRHAGQCLQQKVIVL